MDHGKCTETVEEKIKLRRAHVLKIAPVYMGDIIVILHALDKLKLRIYYCKESKKSVIHLQKRDTAINK